MYLMSHGSFFFGWVLNSFNTKYLSCSHRQTNIGVLGALILTILAGCNLTVPQEEVVMWVFKNRAEYSAIFLLTYPSTWMWWKIQILKRDYFHRGDFRASIVSDPPFRLQVLDVLRLEFPDFPFKYNISTVLPAVLFWGYPSAWFLHIISFLDVIMNYT